VRKYTWIFCGHQGISRKKPQKKDYLLHFNHNLVSFSGVKNNNTLIAMKLPYRKKQPAHCRNRVKAAFAKFFFKIHLTI